jgi:hypothetical protein
MVRALPALLSCGLAVLFRMLPCGVVLVLGGFQVMAKCNPSMMCGFLVVPRLVMLGGLTMMFGSLFIVLRRLFVMLVNLELCHSVPLEIQLTQQIVYALVGWECALRQKSHGPEKTKCW